MKKTILFLLVTLLSITLASAGTQKKGKKNVESYQYDIEYVKTLGDGMVSVKVWTYHKKVNANLEECRKNAVRGVIFKGYAGGGAAHSALVKDVTVIAHHQEFFDLFFANNGDYGRFLSNIQNGSIETVKFGKQYKTGIVATINMKSLRKHLEAAGIIKGLSSGF